MRAPKKKRGFKGLFLVLLLALAAAGYLAWRHYTVFVGQPFSGLRDDQRISVGKGNALPQVLRRLRAAGVTEGFDIEWQVLARQLDAAGKLQVGEYALKNGMTPGELLRNIRDGKVVSYRFTLIDGWNIRDLRKALAKAEPLTHTIDAMTDAQLMAALGHGGQHPEGRFLPETYLYNTGDSDLGVLKQAYAAMDKVLASEWASRAQGLPFKTPDDALTLASIVEKETGNPDDRAKIAGVFVRRLAAGMRLETDPTVIYGMGTSYAGNIRKKDMQTDTPYNTYLRVGLPPTPISMPGKAALQSVMHPAPGDAIYFVSSGDGSGHSLFATTFTEHQANVNTYLARYRAGQAKGPLVGTTTSTDDATVQTPAPAPAGAAKP
ncbi:endolytic transglycosylase MltG [Solilutibacter silvestris]|uniref:Endolytic murein transglycosylase n=1 Tax=Solilutibacter silvestris TaxID=1645665 RepID=A0A2K1PZP3_9GAMM|nr:endolytic transglycosylase MltG [Lysobacter silvestris]PNS08261.1 YceG family protein [Lysobacter silvestris]